MKCRGPNAVAFVVFFAFIPGTYGRRGALDHTKQILFSLGPVATAFYSIRILTSLLKPHDNIVRSLFRCSRLFSRYSSCATGCSGIGRFHLHSPAKWWSRDARPVRVFALIAQLLYYRWCLIDRKKTVETYFEFLWYEPNNFGRPRNRNTNLLHRTNIRTRRTRLNNLNLPLLH